MEMDAAAESVAGCLGSTVHMPRNLVKRKRRQQASRKSEIPYFFRTDKKKAPSLSAKCLIFLPYLVGANGLEPSTPTMSRWC
ncbi:MAG: hypothetical protein K2Y02_06640, partial [Burkholderiaceae bacterium]|nr:hypothetical protein [Burkholderiaceae bacterium]